MFIQSICRGDLVDFDTVSIRSDLRFCILNNLPGDDDVAGPWTTLLVTSHQTKVALNVWHW
jgi:hypothetical protein